MVDNIRKWLNLKLSEIQYKLDIRVKINDRDIAILDRVITRLGDKADKTTEKLTAMFKQAEAGAHTIDEVLKAGQSTFDLMDNINDPKNQETFIKKYGPDAWAEFKKSGELPSEMMDQLDSYADKAMAAVDYMY
jgi:hypothetical protein